MNSDQSFEHDILASFEKGEWQPIKNQKKENARYRELAAATLRKSRRVNIRITAMDLKGLRANPPRKFCRIKRRWQMFCTNIFRGTCRMGLKAKLRGQAGRREN